VARYTVDTLRLVDKFALASGPRAIDISGNEIYVYEYKNSIKVFNILTKEIIRHWKPAGYSYAIKFNDGNLYYANAEDNKIYVYNFSGGLIKQFGGYGSGDGEFRGPHGMDIDGQFIYFAESRNSRVQVLHLVSCSYSHKWGSETSSDDGKLVNPYEIRLYDGFCYVADRNGVQMFTKGGEFLYRFGKTTNGSKIGEFYDVRGILVLGNRLYISDYGNGRLRVYQ